MALKIDWNILSRQRSSLMGVAILFIMLFHCSNTLQTIPLNVLFANGDIGVEFFTFLSAIGVCRSLGNNNSIKRFYIKRIKRIIPPFLIVAVPFSLFLHFKYDASWGHVAVMISGLSAFRDDLAFWFVSFILTCYFITPLLIYIRDRIGLPFITTVIVAIISAAIFLLLKEDLSKSDVWLSRFASFALGIDMAKYVLAPIDKVQKAPTFSILLSFFILAIVVAFTRLIPLGPFRYYSYLLLSPPFMVSIAHILERFNIINRFFLFFGGITLELYLIHERISLPMVQSVVSNPLAVVLISIIFAAILSKILSILVSRIIHA